MVTFVETPACEEMIGAAMPQTYPIIEQRPLAVALMVDGKDSGVYAYYFQTSVRLI
jgi:hypothetical protein